MSQLQPISDRYKQYDEEGRVTYNWVTTFRIILHQKLVSTDPSNPKQTMKELKTMIRAYHEAGISVVMEWSIIISTDRAWSFPNYSTRLLLLDGARWSLPKWDRCWE